MAVIIDGNGMVFGRLSSKVAKLLLQGEEVHLINAEKIVFTGKPSYHIQRYRTKRSLRNRQNPEKSPKWPKVPHMFVKRIMRGMLPWKKTSGRRAYKRLKVHMGVPEGLEGKKISVEDCKFDGKSKSIDILSLCKMIGYGGKA